MNNYLIFFVGGLLVSLFVSNNLEMLKGSFITLLMCSISFSVLPHDKPNYKSSLVLTAACGLLVFLK